MKFPDTINRDPFIREPPSEMVTQTESDQTVVKYGWTHFKDTEDQQVIFGTRSWINNSTQRVDIIIRNITGKTEVCRHQKGLVDPKEVPLFNELWHKKLTVLKRKNVQIYGTVKQAFEEGAWANYSIGKKYLKIFNIHFVIQHTYWAKSLQ